MPCQFRNNSNQNSLTAKSPPLLRLLFKYWDNILVLLDEEYTFGNKDSEQISLALK
jgi:hypothetical protein